MRRILEAFSCVAVLVTGASATALNQTGAHQPYALVRSLDVVQEHITQGSVEAYRLRRTVLRSIATALEQSDTALWGDKKNAEAAATFLLSGARPQHIRSLANGGLLRLADANLIAGALAYAEGRITEAEVLLARIDEKAVPQSVQCHVFLVRAMVQPPKEVARAISLFDRARLLCPGTLVEEAALRNGALAAAGTGDPDAFEHRVSRYFRRFPRSVYMADFIERFAAQAARPTMSKTPGQTAGLIALIDLLPIDMRERALLLLARSAIAQGTISVVLAAAQMLQHLPTRTDAGVAHGTLYEAAALIATGDVAAGVNRLEALPRDYFDSPHQELADTATGLAKRIQKAPHEQHGIEAEPGPTVAAARHSLARADLLLRSWDQ